MKRKIPATKKEFFAAENPQNIPHHSFPKIISYLYDAMIFNGEEKAVLLHQYFYKKFQDDPTFNTNQPWTEIHKELGWWKQKIDDARNILEGYGLILVGREDSNNNFKNKNKTLFGDVYKIDWSSIIKKLKSENKDNPHIKKLEFYDGMKIIPSLYTGRKSSRNSLLHSNKQFNNVGGSKNTPTYGSFSCFEDLFNSRFTFHKETFHLIPQKYHNQISRLRRHLNSLFDNPKYEKPFSKTEVLNQSKVLLKLERKYGWDKMRDVFEYQMQGWWSDKVFTYSNITSKFDTMLNQISTKKSKPKQKEFNVDKYYSGVEKKYFMRIAELIGADNGKMKTLHLSMETLKGYWDTIPYHGFKYYSDPISGFFYDYWQMAEEYAEFLIGKFGKAEPKTMESTNPMFKEFVYKEVPNVIGDYYQMDVENGKFAYA